MQRVASLLLEESGPACSRVPRDQVFFGQLLGMADHLTFNLASHGLKAYKYVHDHCRSNPPCANSVPFWRASVSDYSTALQVPHGPTLTSGCLLVMLLLVLCRVAGTLWPCARGGAIPDTPRAGECRCPRRRPRAAQHDARRDQAPYDQVVNETCSTYNVGVNPYHQLTPL